MKRWATKEIPVPYGLFQWKGTNVCMECYCACGESFHVDAGFADAVKCPYCGTRYGISARVEIREIPAEEICDGCEIVGVREE